MTGLLVFRTTGRAGQGSARGAKRNRRVFKLFYGEAEGKKAMLSTILLIVLVLLLIGALPSWPYSRSWGYAPSGLLTLVVVVVVLLAVTGRL
jgi:hypothetical protein